MLRVTTVQYDPCVVESFNKLTKMLAVFKAGSLLNGFNNDITIKNIAAYLINLCIFDEHPPPSNCAPPSSSVFFFFFFFLRCVIGGGQTTNWCITATNWNGVWIRTSTVLPHNETTSKL